MPIENDVSVTDFNDFLSVLWNCWLGDGKCIQPVKVTRQLSRSLCLGTSGERKSTRQPVSSEKCPLKRHACATYMTATISVCNIKTRSSAIADRPARRAVLRLSCCSQRWTLSVTNWRPTTVTSLSYWASA